MRKSDADFIPLTHLIAALIALGYRGKPVSYPQVYRCVLSGTIPAEQVVSNRWSVRRADLPKVAAALSLTLATNASLHAAAAEQVAA